MKSFLVFGVKRLFFILLAAIIVMGLSSVALILFAYFLSLHFLYFFAAFSLFFFAWLIYYQQATCRSEFKKYDFATLKEVDCVLTFIDEEGRIKKTFYGEYKLENGEMKTGKLIAYFFPKDHETYKEGSKVKGYLTSTGELLLKNKQ
ncbi:MAG: hypothetical protein K5694_02770 [Bacilli bacterium]|nr:hypothetical protein [Bacilli bacterium]